MEEALRFFRTYEIWIYLLLGLGGLIYLRKFAAAWQELKGAAFGLERDSAQARLNSAASILVLLFTMMITEFVLVSFIVPTIPGATPLFTPTLDLLATPTTTLAVNTPGIAVTPVGTLQETPGTPVADGTMIAESTLVPQILAPGEGCVPDQVVIASPVEGSEISGTIEISGTVNIPDFGFYKFEMRPQGSTDWLTILAGNEVKQEELLGSWDTSLLSPGNYQLGLVVTDNQGSSMPACIVNLRVAPPLETPQP